MAMSNLKFAVDSIAAITGNLSLAIQQPLEMIHLHECPQSSQAILKVVRFAALAGASYSQIDWLVNGHAHWMENSAGHAYLQFEFAAAIDDCCKKANCCQRSPDLFYLLSSAWCFGSWGAWDGACATFTWLQTIRYLDSLSHRFANQLIRALFLWCREALWMEPKTALLALSCPLFYGMDWTSLVD